MLQNYSSDRHIQILLYLLKQYGIKKVIASPGTTNISIVASMQQDPYFEMYSAADERSAAYLACGLSGETGEVVVLTCTGATASRNYIPGLTEAYYRKLPVLAITCTNSISRVTDLIPQVLDRSQIQKDIAKKCVRISPIQSKEDEFHVELELNKALNALFTNGGGPVHIDCETTRSRDLSTKELPKARVIRVFDNYSQWPSLPKGRIGIYVGAHKTWTEEQIAIFEQFCSENNAVAFCDQTSGYKGKFSFPCALVGCQKNDENDLFKTDLIIHIGEVSGNYPCLKALKKAKQVWRVSEDGEIRDFGNRLTASFFVPEKEFFKHYLRNDSSNDTSYYKLCQDAYSEIYSQIPENLPFSNIWIAKTLAPNIPHGSALHLGILNTLRSWNFFEVSPTISTSCNVGGFGIDGCVSTLIGASLAHPEKLYFGIFGDLALFYDLNVLLNRHVGKNLRIMLINNGKGTEFRMYSHIASIVGEDADDYIAAAGHYGNKSKSLIRQLSESSGYQYITASNKEEFMSVYEEFLKPEMTQPIIFEIFTDSKDESDALYMIDHIVESSPLAKTQKKASSVVKSIFGKKGVEIVKNIINK